MDVFTKEKRSQIMSRIGGKDTAPERIVRSQLHKLGYRFRLHRKDLPGKPDITLPKHKKIIFVHGCFWHGHPGCRRAKRPAVNKKFWNEKLDKNMKRDAANIRQLRESGWEVLVIWSCEVNEEAALRDQLVTFLQGNRNI